MSAIEELVSNILETRFENIPKDIVERAKDEVIDTIGCAIGGANAFGSPMIVDLVREWAGRGESTILAYGIKGPSHNVALANAIMARSFDFGAVDCYVEGEVQPAHMGETLVPTAVAIAEQKALSGKELLTALIVGEDLVSRILAAATTGKRLGGYEAVNTFGATAVAGKLLGLDNQQLLDAFGIAYFQMVITNQGLVERSSCFKLNNGLTAQNGIFSAKLASKGFVGLKDPFLGRNGYFALCCPDYNAEILTRDLGKKFWTQITFKPWPQLRFTHAPTECALEIVRKNHIEASNIDEVTVIINSKELPPYHEPFTIGRVPQVDATFSYEYTVANALVRGYPGPEHFTEESIRDPRVAEIIRKVKMTAQDWPNESFLASTVRVKMKNGDEFTEHVNVPLGNDLENPLTKEAKREKFRINVSFTRKVNTKNAEKALGMLEKLEEVEDIRKIVSLLVA